MVLGQRELAQSVPACPSCLLIGHIFTLYKMISFSVSVVTVISGHDYMLLAQDL